MYYWLICMKHRNSPIQKWWCEYFSINLWPITQGAGEEDLESILEKILDSIPAFAMILALFV